VENKVLTIAVPSYNAERYLLETIPTILNSKYIDLIDLIIVNDGSADLTREVAYELKNNNPNSIRVIDKENGGHGSAVNTGIEYAIGKYFKVVDADDWVNTENLDTLIEYLMQTDVDEVLSPYYRVYVDSIGSIIREEEYNEFINVEDRKQYSADEFYSLIKQTVGMHTITIKTSILKDNNIRLSEKMFYVDMEYISLILPYVESIVCLNTPIYRYRLGTTTQSVSDDSYIRNREMHKKVILNIVRFYTSINTSEIRKNILLKLIKNLIKKQWTIYFSIEDAEEAKKELIEFERDINNINTNFINDMKLKQLNLIRKYNYKLFKIAKVYFNWRKK
jgi:putative glycosyltransferase